MTWLVLKGKVETKITKLEYEEYHLQGKENQYGESQSTAL